MKLFHVAAGLMGLLVTGSAQATVLYDTLTGQTSSNRLLVLPQQNHAPMGDAFSAPTVETIRSVTVQLIEKNASTDTGSVLLYLVPSVANEPSATGVTLTNDIYLGAISDTALTPLVYTNQTLQANATIAAGNYWLVMTSGSDPTNFNGSVNPVASSAGWGEFIAATSTGTVGLPASNFAAVTNSTDTGFVNDVSGYVFAAQIQVPEPTSLLLLGSGLTGLGLSRRRAKKRVDLPASV